MWVRYGAFGDSCTSSSSEHPNIFASASSLSMRGLLLPSSHRATEDLSTPRRRASSSWLSCFSCRSSRIRFNFTASLLLLCSLNSRFWPKLYKIFYCLSIQGEPLLLKITDLKGRHFPYNVIRGDSMSVTGDRLRALREEKGMSQEAVAEILGISRTAYNKYESGVIKPVRKLEELSALFGVSTDYILGQESEISEMLRESGQRVERQVKKYISLSESGRYMVDVMLDAVYEKEQDPLGRLFDK